MRRFKSILLIIYRVSFVAFVDRLNIIGCIACRALLLAPSHSNFVVWVAIRELFTCAHSSYSCLHNKKKKQKKNERSRLSSLSFFLVFASCHYSSHFVFVWFSSVFILRFANSFLCHSFVFGIFCWSCDRSISDLLLLLLFGGFTLCRLTRVCHFLCLFYRFIFVASVSFLNGIWISRM